MRREIIELIARYDIDFCCIQESKLEYVDAFVCRAIWGPGNFYWSFKPSVGRSGGIISIWNSDKFTCSSCWSMEGAVVVNGYWNADNAHCMIINVYAPCPLSEREDLWDRILCITTQSQATNIYLLGDFNSVRTTSERNGRNSTTNRRDWESFDNFIGSSGLLDLPLHGRTFSCEASRGLYRTTVPLSWRTKAKTGVQNLSVALMLGCLTRDLRSS
ncbi:hypothetical protein ACS0TY_007324 [Phlomoides rotata]